MNKTHRNESRDLKDLENPLGIAESPIARTPGDHVEDNPDPNHRRRRTRALGEDGIDHRSTGIDELTEADPDGAVRVDLGVGGEPAGRKR